MKCLMKYNWVKLQRSYLPQGKGIMGFWAKLASRAAFRKGTATYCGYKNEVIPGMWSGGIVGLKSILGIRNRSQALEIMNRLRDMGYIQYELDAKTKKLSYQILDWVVECSGEACSTGTVYVSEGYGFLCLPRIITERLVESQYIFEEADAWLDLWCHSVSEESGNAFSYLAPAVQYGRYGAVLTLETLGRRWRWEKTKVWRFFQKYRDVFPLYRLPGSFGCLIFNMLYPCDAEVSLPTQDQIMRIIAEIRVFSKETPKNGTDRERLNRLVAWYSKRLLPQTSHYKNRVAVSGHIIRAYISPCWNCKNCIYDCGRVLEYPITVIKKHGIRGPCVVRRLFL